MLTGGLQPMLAALAAMRVSSVLLAIGLVALFILLAGLVWTRFGQARPVSKCIVLSLLAHVLLVVYAYSTHVFYGPPGRLMGRVVKVRIRDARDDEEAAPPGSSDDIPLSERSTSRPRAPEVPSAAVADASEQPAPPAAPPEIAPKSAELAAALAHEPPEAPPEQPAQASPPPKEPDRPQPQLTDLLTDPPDSAPQQAQPPEPATIAAADSPSAPAPELASGPDPTLPAAPPPQFVAATKKPAPVRPGDGQEVPEALQGRIVADRLKAAQPFGATPQTENAVAAALDWLAKAQSKDGRWDADAFGAGRETRTLLRQDRRGAGAHADTGITGLALLALLGSGETHLTGAHREAVQHGLEFLLASQARDGSLAGEAELYAAMYCHGMAALALSEAYALSGDDRLLPGLRRALEFTLAAQTSAGGWRYRARELSDPGDMSQFGWQLMALKSAELGGIEWPTATRLRMVQFLQSCSLGARRGLAGYQPGHRASRTMTAESLVCRYFLETENSPAALAEGAAYVMQECPSRESPNFYYWYYGTLAMFQRQGADWQRWNAALQQELLARQRWDGQLAGSYDPDDLWGGCGGRVYSTALATLSLEVYYRYLPMHGRDTDDSRLTDRPWQPAVAR